MASEDSRRIREIFADTVERPETDRAAFIAQGCGGDSELCLRVEALLRAHDHAGSFLESRPPEVTQLLHPPAGWIGRRIGRYTLRRLVATGGMGSVFEAMQERPHRIVALKLMRGGIASRSALKRFEFEAQLLGRLRHPTIAQVYEAGMHDDPDGTFGIVAAASGPALSTSLPYFAMEYIPGATPPCCRPPSERWKPFTKPRARQNVQPPTPSCWQKAAGNSRPGLPSGKPRCKVTGRASQVFATA